ncbi:MAG: ribonuclease P protein component [Nitrospirales bacterium]|nr:ribonuclease P protein component [Nitrospirales bacterium]
MGKGQSFFLTKTAEFERVRKKGSAIRNLFFTMVYSTSKQAGFSRIGVIAGRRVGNAVKRNRLKRVCRELVRGSITSILPGYECILYPKTRMLQASFGEVKRVWNEMLNEIGLISK